MMTAKATVVLILAYVLALAAGTTSGVLAERMRSAGAVSGAPLAEQLQLTPDQCNRMRSLWQGVNDTEDDCYRQAEKLEHLRDDALVKLLTNEQKAAFASTDKVFAAEFAALSDRREKALQSALHDTEAMLSPDQRVKYEQIVRQRLGRLPGEPGPATQPSIEVMQP
jgi:Spy/CpxP family protein refolding chaperone